jgi:hypothetical protein
MAKFSDIAPWLFGGAAGGGLSLLLGDEDKTVQPTAQAPTTFETKPELSSLTETSKRLNLPQYYQDPMVAKTQAPLLETGLGLLKGDIPDYYKSIGQIGGPLFEDILKGTTADITRAVTEDVARRGGRGGLAADVISRGVGRVTPGLRWQEMMRGIEGRKGLLGYGANILSGVRGAGLTTGAGRRAFDLSTAQLGLGAEQFEKEFGFGQEKFGKTLDWEKERFARQLELERETAEAGLWGDIISGGMSALGSAAGISAMASDKRLKENIVKIGKYKGFNLYRWDWKNSAKKAIKSFPTIGVMAQEVKKIIPEAVFERNGYLMVDYNMIY